MASLEIAYTCEVQRPMNLILQDLDEFRGRTLNSFVCGQEQYFDVNEGEQRSHYHVYMKFKMAMKIYPEHLNELFNVKGGKLTQVHSTKGWLRYVTKGDSVTVWSRETRARIDLLSKIHQSHWDQQDWALNDVTPRKYRGIPAQEPIFIGNQEDVWRNAYAEPLRVDTDMWWKNRLVANPAPIAASRSNQQYKNLRQLITGDRKAYRKQRHLQ